MFVEPSTNPASNPMPKLLLETSAITASHSSSHFMSRSKTNSLGCLDSSSTTLSEKRWVVRTSWPRSWRSFMIFLAISSLSLLAMTVNPKYIFISFPFVSHERKSFAVVPAHFFPLAADGGKINVALNNLVYQRQLKPVG